MAENYWFILALSAGVPSEITQVEKSRIDSAFRAKASEVTRRAGDGGSDCGRLPITEPSAI
jgi:hypothetical protein